MNNIGEESLVKKTQFIDLDFQFKRKAWNKKMSRIGLN